MNLLFIIGSPNGNDSCSHAVAQYVENFLHPDIHVQYAFIPPLMMPRPMDPVQYPQTAALFAQILDKMHAAHGVVWCFGCHAGFVPAGLRRFLSHIFDTTPANAFTGKISGTICTSGRLLDTEAVRKMNELAMQMGFSHLADLSVMGNVGLYYEEELETEQNARKFAAELNHHFNSGHMGITAAATIPRQWLGDRKPVFHPAVSPEKSESGPPAGLRSILVLYASDPARDGYASAVQQHLYRRAGESVEEIILPEKRILPCTTCLRCNQFNHGRCVFDDDVREIVSRIRAAGRCLIVTPVSAYSEAYSLKLLMDRIWVLIHQGGLGPGVAGLVAYGGGSTTDGAAYNLERFLRLSGVVVAGRVMDPEMQGDSLETALDGLLDRVAATASGPLPAPAGDFLADRQNMTAMVTRWGFILRSDFTHYCRHNIIPVSRRIPTYLRWWLFGSPWRFHTLVKLGRWSARRRRGNRIRKELQNWTYQ